MIKTRSAARLVVLGALLCSPSARAEQFDELEIKGEVQKPEVLVVISRENLNKSMDLAKLERSFIDLIIQAVEQPPF